MKRYKMSITDVLLIAVIVVIVCIVLYMVYRIYDRGTRKDMEPDTNQSKLYKAYRYIPDGITAAATPMVQIALDAYNQIEEPNANDNWRMATILHHNIGDRNQAIRFYELAIGDILNGHVNEAIEPAPFIYDRVFDEVNMLNVILGGFPDLLEQTHGAIITTRKEDVINDGFKGKEATDEYLKRSTQFVNDTQNVHSSLVNDSIKNIYTKISNGKRHSNDTMETVELMREIENKIDGKYGPQGTDPNPEKHKNANTILTLFAKNDDVFWLEAKELDVLSAVWNRSKHVANTQNKDNMQEAVVIQLADSVENGMPSCLMGRIHKVISSISGLDFDKEVNSSIKNEDWYRAELFGNTKKTIDREIKRLIESDGELTEQAKNYKEGNGKDTDKIEEHLRSTVETKLRTDYKDLIRDDKLNMFIKEAVAGI